MARRKDLAQRPRRRWELLVCHLRVKFVSPQRPRDEVRSRRHSIVEHGFHRMQQELLSSVRAQSVHANCRGQHAARMKEEV
jgi:hypothetical protein